MKLSYIPIFQVMDRCGYHTEVKERYIWYENLIVDIR